MKSPSGVLALSPVFLHLHAVCVCVYEVVGALMIFPGQAEVGVQVYIYVCLCVCADGKTEAEEIQEQYGVIS